jgi:hypothetical protein
MPFDLDVVLALFQVPVGREWKRISDALEHLGEKIREQAERSSALERASRDFLEWSFQDDALVVALAPSQRFQLRLPAEPLLPAAIRQEWLLPGLFIRLRAVTDAIRNAVRRYQKPSPGMFDRGGSQFSDIFGQAAMLVRAFVLDYRPIRLLEETALQAAILRVLYLGPPQPGQPGGSSLDSLPGMLAGALLLVPAFLGWLTVLAREASLVIRMAVLQKFQEIQETLFSLKQTLLERFFETLRSNFQDAMEFFFAAEHIFLRSVAFYGVFLRIWLTHLARNLADFSNVVSLVVNICILALNAIASTLEALRAFSIVPGLSLGDLLDAISLGTLPGWLTNKIGELAEDAGAASPRLRAIAAVVRAVMRAALNPRYHNLAPLLPRMPDPYAAIAPHLPGILEIFGRLRSAVGPLVRDGLNGTASTLIEMADAADRMARQSVSVGDLSLWRTVAESSAQVSDLAFGGQIRERRHALTEHPDALASTYDRMVAGGFATLQEAIPRYVGGVIDWWHARLAAQPRGTVSPHILARRARMSRVHMPRLRMEVHGFDLQSEERRDALLARLQQKMRQQVELAWGTAELRVAAG